MYPRLSKNSIYVPEITLEEFNSLQFYVIEYRDDFNLLCYLIKTALPGSSLNCNDFQKVLAFLGETNHRFLRERVTNIAVYHESNPSGKVILVEPKVELTVKQLEEKLNLSPGSLRIKKED